MPLVIAPLVGLALGIALGARKAGALGAGGAEASERCALAFALLAFFPAVAFAALYEPSWSYLHLGFASGVPAFATLVASAVASATVVAGHRAGRSLAARPGRGALVGTTIPLGFALLLAAGLRHRLAVLVHAGTPTASSPAVALLGSRFSVGLGAIDALLAVATWLTLRSIDSIASPSEPGFDGARKERTPIARSLGARNP